MFVLYHIILLGQLHVLFSNKVCVIGNSLTLLYRVREGKKTDWRDETRSNDHENGGYNVACI